MGSIFGYLICTYLVGFLIIITVTKANTLESCANQDYVGDGRCDDGNNNAYCWWDGGDCCNNKSPGWDDYCNDCMCLDPAVVTTPMPGSCTPYVGDGLCDDENNYEDCNWDGGDCCNNNVGGWDHYCYDCKCLDPAFKSGDVCSVYVGNGYCDDANNNENCNWDGGDCCGNNGNEWDSYCSDCLCLDPIAICSIYKGDGVCDDENNNVDCQWDGGDCCNNNVEGWNDYCTDCLCLDPQFGSSKGSCANADFVGDGLCDDGNNNEGCSWDGGDCCKNENQDWNSWCEECQCLDPAYNTPSICSEYVGDGACDDENNNQECQWDGGDCCNNNEEGWNNYCTDCQCLDPQFSVPKTACADPDYVGDGQCDDGNNNEGCNWDDGDCCNTENPNWDQYCDDCRCLDPSVDPPPTDGCDFATFADGYCNDGNNNAGCLWDGGDCCKNNMPGWDNNCTYCRCLDPNPDGVCLIPHGKGDGVCDDFNNNKGCDWDGGDCCNNNNPGFDEFCFACECKDPAFN